MAYFLSPINSQITDANGNPLVGGKIYTYQAGTSTALATFTDSTSGTQQANPIILNSLGIPASPIWLQGGIAAKFVIQDSTGVTQRTVDNISGVNDVSNSTAEWNDSGFVPTYISATSFSVPGDQTALFQVNRRVRTKNSSGLVYGRIITSVYTTITTVTVVNDSSAIDSGLSLVAVGFLSYSPSSVPYALYAGGGTNSDITSLTALTSVPNGTVSNFPSVLGAFRNLVASSTGSSANVTVTADEIVLSNATNQYVTLRTVSLTIAGTTTGANALDTGTIAASTWYSVWIIWNGTTTAGLLSLSATAPTLPSGYTHKARIGWVRTDGTGNKYPFAFKQYGRKVRYVVAGNVTALPQIAGASVGAPNTPTWVSQSTANFAPTTIANISLMAVCNGAGSKAICAPSNAYGSYSSTTNPPPMAAGASSAANVATTSNYDMILETANTLYWASDATAVLACTGWEDNL